MTARRPPILDPLRFRLRGSALIEASAGTGKTFTIAALYLRLVLGHGGERAHPQALVPREILVVTFTEAATKELRDRIRTRLAQAARRFAAPEEGPADDFIDRLRADIPVGEWTACARRLELAAEGMDEAAIHTIHGWCQRMLHEHAFDSDSLFTQKLEPDQQSQTAEAVRDYWRSFFYGLDAPHAQAVAGWWAEPEALARALDRLLPHAAALAADLQASPREALQAAGAALDALKAPWREGLPSLRALLQSACERGHLGGTVRQHLNNWLEKIGCWAEQDEPWPFKPDAAAIRNLSAEGLQKAWKGPGAPPTHPLLDRLAQMPAQVDALPEARPQLLRHAAVWVSQRVRAENQRRAEMGFDDLLLQLDRALQARGGGDRLAARIRTQFPVALIDEFQDTDPVQWRIFDRVYDIAADDPARAVILIGDPKQAIYGFRGADIHTYLAARRATDGRHATLGTNHRSSEAMVQAVNHLFDQAEQRPQGRGAFLFRREGDDPMPFFPVAARGREDRWYVEGQPAPALTGWWLHEDKPLGSQQAVQRMALACAGEVLRLLQLAGEGQAGFRTGQGTMQPLKAGDIAVLVNSGREARAVREALEAVGVRSCYLSDQDSVMASEAAGDLQRWLQACAEPADPVLLRAALATGLLGLDWQALDRLNTDDLHWDERLRQFARYHEQWRRQGVLPLVRQLLADFSVPQRLLARGEERCLTDLLHLAELLQQASTEVDGEHALVRWLARQREDDRTASEARLVRLESDADLLKVVTVHKSKGLEYPLVFLPFAFACREARAEDLPLKWHDDEGRLHLDIGDSSALARVDEERLAEDLRKLYVALTRARHATWVGVAATSALPRSALGYLLDAAEGTRVDEAWRAAFTGRDSIALAPAPEAATTRLPPQAVPRRLGAEPPLGRQAADTWRIGSYSGLRIMAAGLQGGDAVAPTDPALTAQEATYLEAGEAAPHEDLTADPIAEVDATSVGIHAFPRGPGPGSFLHGVLEWAGREGFSRVLAAQAERIEMLRRRLQPRGWDEWIDALDPWLASWLDRPLDLSALAGSSAPVRLADLRSVQVEMEFWLPARHVSARRLDAVVRAHTLDGAPRPALAPDQLHGLLKGFIDLVFEHEGRFYVLDYKSNHLGNGPAAYTAPAMRDLVLHHRYELQYALYLFALHRLLRARLGERYDYERHVGGAVYAFVRGIDAPSQGLHLERPPRALMDQLDALFAGQPVEVVQ